MTRGRTRPSDNPCDKYTGMSSGRLPAVFCIRRDFPGLERVWRWLAAALHHTTASSPPAPSVAQRLGFSFQYIACRAQAEKRHALRRHAKPSVVGDLHPGKCMPGDLHFLRHVHHSHFATTSLQRGGPAPGSVARHAARLEYPFRRCVASAVPPNDSSARCSDRPSNSWSNADWCRRRHLCAPARRTVNQFRQRYNLCCASHFLSKE